MGKNIIKVKIKDLTTQQNFEGVDIHTDFKFKKITLSIEKEGFNPERYGYPSVLYEEENKKFRLEDGNHRCKILKELYGDDYEVQVEEQNKILNIPLGDIFGVFDEDNSYTSIQKFWINIRTKFYRWKALRTNLKENGYDPKNFSYIEVVENLWRKNQPVNIGNKLKLPYICVDGNHRLKVLKDMHSPEHKIRVHTKLTEMESCVKKATPTKEDLKEPRKILEYLKGLTICLYFFVFHLKLTGLMLLTLFSLFLVLPEFKKEGENHIPHNKLKWMYNKYKFIYSAMMTIYHNLRLILCGATLFTFAGYLIIYDTITFLILSGVVVVIQTIQQKFYPENEDND